jgi:hypothetical protein
LIELAYLQCKSFKKIHLPCALNRFASRYREYASAHRFIIALRM